MEKVDILLATYNGEKYLRPQLDSILAQSHGDMELLVSDDASSDSTRDILREYAARDPRITLYMQDENIGFVKNFEFLLTKSKARYIAFADQDDIWDANKLEIMLSVLKTSGKSLAYCDMRRIDGNGNVVCDSWIKDKCYPRLNGTAIDKCAVRHFAAGCSQLFTASVRQRMLPFKDCVFAHDWISVFCAAELMGIIYIGKPLVDYRAHEDNVYGSEESYSESLLRHSGGDASYKGFLKYRASVIYQNHTHGVKMCAEYSSLGSRLHKTLTYLEKCANAHVFPPLPHNYFMNMKPSGCGKRTLYELTYLHFPLLFYIAYRRILKGRG